MIDITVVIVDEWGRSKPTPLRDPTLAATAPFKYYYLENSSKLHGATVSALPQSAEGIFAATADGSMKGSSKNTPSKQPLVFEGALFHLQNYHDNSK